MALPVNGSTHLIPAYYSYCRRQCLLLLHTCSTVGMMLLVCMWRSRETRDDMHSCWFNSSISRSADASSLTPLLVASAAAAVPAADCNIHRQTGGHVSDRPQTLLVVSFTARMPLLTTTSAFRLGRRHRSSPEQCYLQCLCTSSLLPNEQNPHFRVRGKLLILVSVCIDQKTAAARTKTTLL